jgi:16S rRNA G966 N2-methylase RsmD
MDAFGWAVRSVRERGLLQTMKVATSVVADLSFDWRYGTDTTRWVKVADLGVVGENQIHGVDYQPSKARPLRKLFNSLDLPREGVFVDFGSGKGRVLLIAVECGFRKLVGVEFSPELCECTRRNMQIFKQHGGLTAHIDIVLSDVANYRIQPDQRVFFMYNPFDEAVMAQVVVNLRRSVELAPRKIWLIYNTPKHHLVIERAGLFCSHVNREFGGTQFRVYTNQ